MNSINLLQNRKLSKFLPFAVFFLGIIPYYDAKDNGYLNIVLAIFLISFLLSIISAIMFNFDNITEKRYYFACLLSEFALQFGLINVWLMTIKNPLFEISILFLFLVCCCALGFCFLLKKPNPSNDKKTKIRYGLISIVSCLGILLARFLSLFFSQNLLFNVAKIAWEFVICIYSFVIGASLFNLVKAK